MKTLRLSIKSHIKVETSLHQYLKHNGLLNEFSNLVINLPFKEIYSLEDIILESITPTKWIKVCEDFNHYIKELENKPFSLGEHEKVI